MRIGELARRAGVSVRSLRYYEEQGLLVSVRSARGQRLYAEADVDRVILFRRLYGAGLSSTTIAELLPCVDAPSTDNSDQALLRLEQERDRLNQHIAELTHTRDSLDALMAIARHHRDGLVATGVRAACA